MIICTGCGKKNDDDNRFCEECGKKLQSSRLMPSFSNPLDKPLGQFEHEGISKDTWHTIKRMLEAWAYVVVLGGVLAVCTIYEIWWPLYPAVGLLGLLAWARRI